MKVIHQLNLMPWVCTLLRQQPEPMHSLWKFKQVTVRTPPPPASIPAYKDLSHDFSWKPEITKSFTEAGNKLRSPDDRRQKITAVFASSIFIGSRCRCRQIALQPGCRSGKRRQDWNLSCGEIRAGSFNCTGFAGEENSGTAFS